MKVLHVITGLGLGGAEAMLAKLISSSKRYRHVVVSLTDRGAMAQSIEASGGTVHALHVNRASGLLGAPMRLALLVRQERPDVIQGWLNHGNLAAVGAKILARVPTPVAYNIRQSLLGLRFEKWETRQVIRLNARLSRRTAAIVYNSLTGADDHEAIGYDPTKRRFVPNGFDPGEFFPSDERRRRIRQELGIADDEVVVGLIARFHPWKNHRAFFDAASRIVSACPKARFLLAGKDMVPGNEELESIIPDSVLARCLLLGPRLDMSDLNRALDVACNVSHGEGFPNTIGEAMASAVPCVVTDVSDMREIVGDTGRVCRPDDPQMIAEAILELVNMEPAKRLELGQSARARISAKFSLQEIVSQYESIYDELVAGNRIPRQANTHGRIHESD
jgi:glycosyltransferase involved in cell wall biosynthesis